MELNQLISTAVAERMTPEFIEKEVQSRVDKLIVECIDRALRTYSPAGKAIEDAVTVALHVARIDLPSYGNTVTKILKAQIESRVSEQVAGRLASDMEELLSLAPKTIKLSQIADGMRERSRIEYGPAITVVVRQTEYDSTWLYLDEEEQHDEHDARSKAEVSILLSKDGTISSATIGGRPTTDTRHIGRCYGLEQLIRAYVACGTVIELDEHNVVTSIGDY